MHLIVRVAVIILLAFGASAPLRADLVTDWIETGNTALANAPGAQSNLAKILARLAIFNALNAITPQYKSYAPAPETDPGASPEAAVAMAAWTVLASVPFADRAVLDERLRSVLDRVAEGPAKATGITLGKRAALALLAARVDDNFNPLAPTARAPAPGIFELTPGHKRPSSVHMKRLRPFAIRSLDICEPGPPPSWDSEQAIADARRSRDEGGRDSAKRTADQTAAALFWNAADDADEFNALKDIARRRQLPPLQTARMFALFALAAIDGSICNAVIKDKYQVWRPYNAIRGRFAAKAVREETWEPLISTPSNPDYPSGTAALAGIYERLLRVFNPDNTVPPVWRSKAIRQIRVWRTTDSMCEEMAASRVWAGIHSAFAVKAGLLVGRRIADEVLATQLLPLAR
jgi:hypothetical protein